MLAELLFIALALVLLYAGSNLARYGDAVAEKTRISSIWVGLFLVAAVTSLPELVTGVSSIVVVGQPDLAVGDALGSTIYNLMLAAGAGLLGRRILVTSDDARLYRLTLGYLALMLATVAIGLVAARVGWGARWLGLPTAALIVLYLAATRHVFRIQTLQTRPPTTTWAHVTRRRALGLYALFGALTIAAALTLPLLGERIADERGIDRARFGTVLLAASTSLPELVVTVSALRLAAAGIALGGLLGSNLFDLAILAVDDLFYAPGPLLLAIELEHLATLAVSLLASVLVVVGLPAGRRPRRGFHAAAFAACFVLLLAWSSGRLVVG